MGTNDTAQPTPRLSQVERTTVQRETVDTDANPTAGEEPTQDAGIGQYQAQLDAIVQSRLAEERRRLQTKYGNFDDLAEAKRTLDDQRAAEMSELEKLQKQLADKDAEIVTANKQAESERLNALRLRVGQEIGLPTVLAARLQGADETELKADAEAVKAVMGTTSTPRIPNIDAAAGGSGQTGGRTTVNLTPAQKKIADDRGMPYEKYAELLQQYEE